MNNLKIFLEGLKEGRAIFQENIAAIINSILLSILYLFGIGLTSIIAKIFHKRFFNNNNKKESYWQNINLKNKSLEDYYKQY